MRTVIVKAAACGEHRGRLTRRRPGPLGSRLMTARAPWSPTRRRSTPTLARRLGSRCRFGSCRSRWSSARTSYDEDEGADPARWRGRFETSSRSAQSDRRRIGSPRPTTRRCTRVPRRSSRSTCPARSRGQSSRRSSPRGRSTCRSRWWTRDTSGMATGFAVGRRGRRPGRRRECRRGGDGRPACGRGDDRAVLRRHAGVPAPWWSGRRGGRARRVGARGQAAAAGQGRPHRSARRGPHLRAVRSPGSRSSRCGRLATSEVDIAVSHLSQRRAGRRARCRAAGRIPHVRRRVVTEVGAVIGAHVGPGMLAVVVAPRPDGVLSS